MEDTDVRRVSVCSSPSVLFETYCFALVGAGATAMTYDWLSPEAGRLNYFVKKEKVTHETKVENHK